MPTATTNDVTNNPSDELSSTEQMGDQEFLVLDSLEVKVLIYNHFRHKLNLS